MNTLVFFRNDKFYFNTCLTSRAFARARFAERLDEKGWLCSKENGVWKFSSFCFSETEEENDFIYLTAPGFDGMTLASIVEESDDAEKSFALALTVKVYEQSLIQNIKLDAVGAGGIFFSRDFNRVLFVPPLFFKTALNVLGSAEYTLNQGLYINPNLKGENAVRYTQCALSYRILTGHFPYEENTYEKQDEDFRDRNFIHIKNQVYGLKTGLADFIDDGLLQNPLSKEALKSFAVKQFPLETLYMEAGLESDGSIPESGKLNSVERRASVSVEEFERQRQHAIEKKDSVVNKKRWIRKHRTLITAVSAAFAVMAVVCISYYSSWRRKPCTKGLTSLEVVRAYYTGINILDSDITKHCSDGKSMKDRDKVISNIYASIKQMIGMDVNREAQTPAKWLNYNQMSFRIFGLSNFTVNGNSEELYFYAPARKEKESPLTEEDGKKLKNSDTAVYTVQYYLVNNALSPEIKVEKYTDTVTLTYKKDRWLVTSIDSNFTESSYDTEEFNNDYKNALEESSDDLKSAVRALRDKYDFVPGDSELEQAAVLIAGSQMLSK